MKKGNQLRAFGRQSSWLFPIRYSNAAYEFYHDFLRTVDPANNSLIYRFYLTGAKVTAYLEILTIAKKKINHNEIKVLMNIITITKTRLFKYIENFTTKKRKIFR